MTEEKKEKKYYILGKVSHQDDTSSVELLGEEKTENGLSNRISDIMNGSFPPSNLFVIEGVRKEIEIKAVKLIEIK